MAKLLVATEQKPFKMVTSSGTEHGVTADDVRATDREALYTFMIISRLILRRMRNVSDESCRENQNAILRSVTFFLFFENRALNEINVEKILYSRNGACALHTGQLRLQDTHSEYVTIFAFPVQQCLHERASM
jgi:hypothetical protein